MSAIKKRGGEMITLYRTGNYKLIETKHDTKVLYLDEDIYAWVKAAGIGHILITSHKAHTTDYLLSCGSYRLYAVEDEPEISDHIHLELEVGVNAWQGYLLLTGLPDEDNKKARIIPTSEIITGNSHFKYTSADESRR